MPPAAPPQRPGGERQPCRRTEAAAAPSHNAPLTPPWGGGEKVPLPGLGSAEGSEKCARALTSAGPSNQSSDSSNGRNGKSNNNQRSSSQMENLRILSLGRNNIKNLNGLEAVGDTLEELWISYNFIEKLKGIHVMKKLKILYMSNNLVKDWAEFVKLAELPCLEDLVFVGNPLEEKHSAEGNWIEEATKRVPKLKKLDGTPVIKEDEEEDN
uniref:Dynein axonemal light chain 1 n=1 Tax=Panthera leo TaxID=9689 RepID=A0A8C8WBE2_PANLE